MATTMNEYQIDALQTAIFPENVKVSYPALKLAGEAGEVAEKIGKLLRQGRLDGDKELSLNEVKGIADELGDVLWYLAILAHEFDVDLEYVAKANLAKLGDRAARGTLHSDNR